MAADALPGLRSVRPAVNLFTILAGPSPGVQGAAATGRPLCAPCA
ncbi:DNA helicase, partial [Klebsiella pneumoniae]